ncbi:Ribosomal RNA large subunit methyltransferase F [Emticicia oligotrophica DSM 17448]|uniref:Ribosomal RNA large subunit methyltransferase F n=1 Tax=Emticicia oligotrophica (strain DSM 17448 / CIP 109782 / MTCC 6937 / GPTSA100-15) TaxID=929562 RepID=A0ABN4AQQ0_EMTOG|nr:23S rRNA (adenine(1618)-N(6))-methyltransferase RlmF [Emticicia oligotrophica]AFK04759.1 Ribosomal RNA large subunit methyltransferase F [Emticicia oligotrophica DSM 17448]
MHKKGSTKSEKKEISNEKLELHPRNPHRFRYDFRELTNLNEALKPFVFVNKFGTESIDFSDQDAVKALNQAILKQFYNIPNWDIPQNYLCPPIPGRADYIHYLADLLADNNKNTIPTGKRIKVLDIGVGANCIYPIIGSQAYGWDFVGADIDPVAIKSAQNIVKSNNVLANKIEFRLQPSSNHIFKGIINPNESFDASICNPPFHASSTAAAEGNERKNRNLGLKNTNKLNFGGQNAELWCEGGEEAFVRNMIFESKEISQQITWFTSLISKKEHLLSIYYYLKQVNALQVKTINMAQGQKISRIVAWTFKIIS